ncbi:MAG: hypothetical protein QOK40_644, partial [Miltoncostaeaceae bacterium]|nr:hypothetical protein [Miltoncostaeaceae bacterium]
MRRFLAVAALAAVFASSSALASAAVTTITLVSVQIKEKATATGLTIWDNDVRAGKRIGHDRLICTFTPKGTAACRIGFVLAAGTIRAGTQLSQT